MRPSLYITLCLLSASSSEATLFSRTANRIHHAAVKRSSRLARDIRSVFNNVLIEQPIIASNSGNRVYCVANPPGGVQNPTSTPTANGGGNPIIISSMSPGSSNSRRPTPTPTSTPTSTSTSGASPVPTATSPWTLVETRAGSSFFDGWDFWSLAGVSPSFLCWKPLPHPSFSRSHTWCAYPLH